MLKSTIARDVLARYTTGKPMPECGKASMPAGYAIYLYAEETEAAVLASLSKAGADMSRVLLLPATLTDGDPLNVMDHLEELRLKIREYGVRLVVIDGQNSVVGAPNICTDMLARHNITNKLHRFAQQENVCLLGIRNEDNEGRAYGPASFGDIRAVHHAGRRAAAQKRRALLHAGVRKGLGLPAAQAPVHPLLGPGPRRAFPQDSLGEK